MSPEGMKPGLSRSEVKEMIEQTEIITQQCECCGECVNQMELLWDLEEDRLVCKECFKNKSKE
jgi:formylmethanofuran dehydrogenase subunit E